ncbi:hypothetical protein ACFE04_020253 [Oxalis oulophora]
MRNDDHIPVRHVPQPQQQPKRHHSYRYYMHRVEENLTTRVSKVLCSVFLTLLFVVGMVAFILWLSLRPHRPRFHIREFSIPGLSQADGFENAEIIFNFTIRNPNQQIGIYYDSMACTVYYRDQKIGAKPLLYPFYQDSKNTTIVNDRLSGATLTVNSQRWTEFLNDRSLGTVVFQLDITSAIKFHIFSWESHRHRMHATCDVSVGPDGLILPISKDMRCPDKLAADTIPSFKHRKKRSFVSSRDLDVEPAEWKCLQTAIRNETAEV